MQSPIDINQDVVRFENMGLPLIEYENTKVEKLENNGWSILFHCQGENYFRFKEISYRLSQFHFHSMSEHTFEGVRFPMELHLVHESIGGDLLVFGILFDYGPENDVLKKLWMKLPDRNITFEDKIPIDLNQVINLNEGFFVYSGSLTTPPFTENVKWIVQKNIARLSEAQVQQYRAIFGKETFRETQEGPPKSVVFSSQVKIQSFDGSFMLDIKLGK